MAHLLGIESNGAIEKSAQLPFIIESNINVIVGVGKILIENRIMSGIIAPVARLSPQQLNFTTVVSVGQNAGKPTYRTLPELLRISGTAIGMISWPVCPLTVTVLPFDWITSHTWIISDQVCGGSRASC